MNAIYSAGNKPLSKIINAYNDVTDFKICGFHKNTKLGLLLLKTHILSLVLPLNANLMIEFNTAKNLS